MQKGVFTLLLFLITCNTIAMKPLFYISYGSGLAYPIEKNVLELSPNNIKGFLTRYVLQNSKSMVTGKEQLLVSHSFHPKPTPRKGIQKKQSRRKTIYIFAPPHTPHRTSQQKNPASQFSIPMLSRVTKFFPKQATKFIAPW